jgi:hypothetical protein
MRRTRRSFLKTAGTFLAAVSGGSWALPPLKEGLGQAANVPGRISEVLLDLNNIHKWNLSNGDTWDPFWADDDNLYAFNCDGRGFGTAPRNLAFNRFSGDSPHSLNGVLVNSMDDYGAAGKKEEDNATWKACGQECIDSVFYAFVSRNVYGQDSGDYWLRQTAFNCSLIKSTDKGLTWTRSAAENYKHPMWPGPAFGAPFFVHYGKNGGAVAQDGANRNVYAVSNNGFWNDGDYYIIARVPRAKLPDLKASDWTYFIGGDGNNGKSWSSGIEEAAPILSVPRRCGQTPPCYIASLGVYLMVVWYNTEKMTKWFEPNEMRYDFDQAEHPWGPWTAIDSHSDRFLSRGHMYGPSLCAQFQHRTGTDVNMVLFTSGCPFEDEPSGLYKAWAIPLILKTGPVAPSTLVPNDDERIVYTGKWGSSGEGRPAGAVHDTANANASAELTFRGTGIDYLADKNRGFGSIDVYVDGAFAQNVSLALEDFPRVWGVVVFRARRLRDGIHTIRIVNKTAAPVVIDAFRVYGGGAVEATRR